MIARVYSAALIGLDTQIIEVEIDIRKGKNGISIVGLPDKAVSEAKERIIPALKNIGLSLPKGMITINLAPADIHKSGAIYDLPIIAGILLASKEVVFDPKNKIFLGEISLDGQIRSVKGVLSMIDGAGKLGFKKFFIPEANQYEAMLVNNYDIYSLSSIGEMIKALRTNKIPKKDFKAVFNMNSNNDSSFDLKYLRGQEQAKRALIIAAAGNHNCLLSGVPGSGKTYLSKCLPGILPRLSYDESIEVTRIYSVAGLLNSNEPILTVRPFRSPHHTISHAGLVGGGTIPRPGEVTLAHRGVLFLDEFPEFQAKSLEALRQPLEDKIISISRAQANILFPANFMLLAAMNPCKCGFKGDIDKECICSQSEVIKYQKKISGPIMDRIDLQVKVPKVPVSKLTSKANIAGSDEVLELVHSVRKIQRDRFINTKINTNSEMSHEDLKAYVSLKSSSLELLKSAIDSLNLSARSYYRILKISRTIADIEGKDSVDKDHIAEALTYRIVY